MYLSNSVEPIAACAASLPKEPAREDEREWDRLANDGALAELMVLGFDRADFGVLSRAGSGADDGPGDV